MNTENKFVTRKTYETEMTLVVCDADGNVTKPTVTVPGDWENKEGRGLKKLVTEAWKSHGEYATDKTLVSYKVGEVYETVYRMPLDKFLANAEVVTDDEGGESNAE